MTALRSLICLRSISFSGAGFLTSYHFGVVACLMEHGIIPDPNSDEPLPFGLAGVSGGAMVASAIACGVRIEDGMQLTIGTVKRTQNLGGFLGCFRPGFSILDQVELRSLPLLKKALGSNDGDNDDYDMERFLRRTDGGKLIRIGMTDRRISHGMIGYNPQAYAYVDQFRSVEDLVAACVLSSYVPGVTGPLLGSHAPYPNRSVRRAHHRLNELIVLGAVKHGVTHEPVRPLESEESREVFWDGGMVNMFPIFDKDTLVVTPLGARLSPNPFISRYSGGSEASSIPNNLIRINERAEFELCMTNLTTLTKIVASSDVAFVEKMFSHGYDDASDFLSRHNLMAKFKVTTPDEDDPSIQPPPPPEAQAN